MRRLHPPAVAAFTIAAALSAAIARPNTANAAPILYVISNVPSNPTAGPGQLNPGTLTGNFEYDSTTGMYSSVSLDFEGLQSTNLNGSYELDTNATSTGTDLLIQGITPVNSGGQSNENSFLDVNFNASLAGSSDQIIRIFSFQGNPADLTTPPMVAFADPVPEPASLALLATGLLGFSLTRRRSKVG